MSNSSSEISNLQGVSVKTGFPNPAAEQLLDNPDFNRLLIHHSASTFCMRLEGTDWEDQGIFSGDIVVIDRALLPKKTSLVVWWEESFRIGKFIKVPLDTPIWGVVTAIIHQLGQRAESKGQRYG
jgi:DNA polymerase V